MRVASWAASSSASFSPIYLLILLLGHPPSLPCLILTSIVMALFLLPPLSPSLLSYPPSPPPPSLISFRSLCPFFYIHTVLLLVLLHIFLMLLLAHLPFFSLKLLLVYLFLATFSVTVIHESCMLPSISSSYVAAYFLRGDPSVSITKPS